MTTEGCMNILSKYMAIMISKLITFSSDRVFQLLISTNNRQFHFIFNYICSANYTALKKIVVSTLKYGKFVKHEACTQAIYY